MYIKLKETVTPSEREDLKRNLRGCSLGVVEVEDNGCYKLGIMGDKSKIDKKEIESITYVEGIYEVKAPYKFVSREFKNEDTIIDVKGIKIGAGNFVVMAGPCSVEDKEMIMEVARVVKESGGHFLRGGAFKPRTSPYDFQGLGEKGLRYMREAADMYGLLVVTEIMDAEDIELVSKYADMLQVGARNMQNFSLLKKLGGVEKPILLKRGMSAKLEDMFMAAEYIVAFGNTEIVFCERGIRTFETITRNTLDINAIPMTKELSHLPIIIDASHGTGKRSLVEPITLAGVVAGADGAMIEIHPVPEQAYSDGPQSLRFNEFEKLMKKVEKIREIL